MIFAPESRFGSLDPKVMQICDELERRQTNSARNYGGYQSRFFDKQDVPLGRTIFNVLIGLTAFIVVLSALVFAFNQIDWRKSPSEAQLVMSKQISTLQSDILALSQDNLALTMEVRNLTDDKGVLVQIVSKLKQQRQINTAHNAAIRQIMAATGTMSAALPATAGFQDIDMNQTGAQRVQVTPVAANNDTPQKVVVTPSATSEGATN